MASAYDDVFNEALAEAVDKARQSETMEEWHRHYADGMDVLRHSPATGEDWVKQREHFSDTLFRDADPTGLPDFERFEPQGGPADEAFRIGRDAHVMRKTMEQDHDDLMARAAQGELVAEAKPQGWTAQRYSEVGEGNGQKQEVSMDMQERMTPAPKAETGKEQLLRYGKAAALAGIDGMGGLAKTPSVNGIGPASLLTLPMFAAPGLLKEVVVNDVWPKAVPAFRRSMARLREQRSRQE